jgi:phosphatidylinositol alpha-1,6-mannosyltransferase
VEKIHCGRCIPEGVTCLALKRLYRLPYLCYVHGEDVNTASCSREHAWLVRRVLHEAEFLIANSRNTKRILLDEWAVPASHVHVLHPGVDTEYFTPAERDSTVRDRLGWRGRPVILTVGRLQQRKGHDVMIRALSSIRQAVPDILYAIVGDGEERPRLAALVEEKGLAGHVQFHGEANDAELLECYQQCDVFVLPNRQVGKDIEGFGMVLLEAQACGKAVVAGTSGGTAETMRVPETGRVVDCVEPGPLAELMTEMLADRTLLLRMGDAARSWVVEHFDWAVLSRQARRLFNVQPGSQSVQSPVEPVLS